jgi:hypothetical protein
MAGRPASRQRWWTLVIGGLVTAVLLSGCTGGHRSTAVTLPLHRISSRIVLSTTRAMAGQTIDGVLVVDNPGPAVNLTATARCRPTFAVSLSNSRINYQPVIPLDCSIRPFVIAHGTTRLRFTIPTTYSGCQPGPVGADANTPTCLPTDAMPSLPHGSYQAMETGLDIPDPKPVAVTLTG